MFCLFFYLVLFCVACVSGQYQNCNGCVVYTNCHEATRLLKHRSPENDQKLRDASCGFEGKTPMVCCDNLTSSKIDLLPQDCGYMVDKKSFDSSTGLYDFPWMALLGFRIKKDMTVQFSCAGTVINSRYVLTVAHCIQGYWQETQVLEFARIGEYNLDTKLDCIMGEPECEHNVWDIKIENRIIHEGYQNRPTKILNDIGLLRLETEIDFTFRNAKAICLPLTTKLREQNITNLQAKIAGWGTTDTGEQSPVLVSTDIQVRDNEECERIFNAKKHPKDFIDIKNKLCAGGQGQSACAGDSGVPLMISGRYHSDDRTNRWIQYGIVSLGRGCDGSFPDIYTDVSKYVDWILDKIQP